MLSDAIERPILQTYREYLATLPQSRGRIRVMRAIDEGRASMSGSEGFSVRHALWFASRAGRLISDLRLLILRNDAGVPFIMGDTPCLCSNHYLRDVRGVGVLGLSQRGLMMYMPIDSQTAVLLIDKAVYRAPRFQRDCVPVGDPEDVAGLNALEVCGAQECLYFADWADRTYVRNLADEHPVEACSRLAGFKVLGPASGEATGSAEIEAFHTYEEQLPVTIELSFVRTQTLPTHLNPVSPRRPVVNESLAKELGVGRRGGGLGIDELVRQVESQLVIAP